MAEKRKIIVHPYDGGEKYIVYISPDEDPQKFIEKNLKNTSGITIAGLVELAQL